MRPPPPRAPCPRTGFQAQIRSTAPSMRFPMRVLWLACLWCLVAELFSAAPPDAADQRHSQDGIYLFITPSSKTSKAVGACRSILVNLSTYPIGPIETSAGNWLCQSYIPATIGVAEESKSLPLLPREAAAAAIAFGFSRLEAVSQGVDTTQQASEEKTLHNVASQTSAIHGASIMPSLLSRSRTTAFMPSKRMQRQATRMRSMPRVSSEATRFYASRNSSVSPGARNP